MMRSKNSNYLAFVIQKIEVFVSPVNYKHLRYFWSVAKAGSIARASQSLHLTAHAISAQIASLEAALGVPLFDRVGRRLVLTRHGERIVAVADEIFALGDEILDIARDAGEVATLRVRLGIADSVPKSVATRLLGPVLRLDTPVHLSCREGRLASLLGELALHRLDAVIADRPLPSDLSVRAHSHLLGESGLAVFAAPALTASHPGVFPALLDGAPFLMPGEDVAFRGALTRWFARQRIRPRIVAEVDDLALLKAFGQEGVGFFVAPAAIATYICQQYDVREVGEVTGVREELFLITPERRVVHPVLQSVLESARHSVFSVPEPSPARRGSGSSRRRVSS